MNWLWRASGMCLLQADCLPDKKMLKMKASFSIRFEHIKKVQIPCPQTLNMSRILFPTSPALSHMKQNSFKSWWNGQSSCRHRHSKGAQKQLQTLLPITVQWFIQCNLSSCLLGFSTVFAMSVQQNVSWRRRSLWDSYNRRGGSRLNTVTDEIW